MKNSYKMLSDPSQMPFDLEELHVGDIGVEVITFKEKNASGKDIIELGLEIFWTAKEEDQQHFGKKLDFPIFFAENSALTVKMLKDMFRKGGFDLTEWSLEGTPPERSLPGALKYLAVNRVPLIAKVTSSTRDNNTRKFLNLVKILRVDPVSGEKYPDAIPDKISGDEVEEAANTVLETDTPASVI